MQVPLLDQFGAVWVLAVRVFGAGCLGVLGARVGRVRVFGAGVFGAVALGALGACMGRVRVFGCSCGACSGVRVFGCSGVRVFWALCALVWCVFGAGVFGVFGVLCSVGRVGGVSGWMHTPERAGFTRSVAPARLRSPPLASARLGARFSPWIGAAVRCTKKPLPLYSGGGWCCLYYS